MKNLLIAIDFNKASKNALAYAQALATQLQTGVVAVHILSPDMDSTDALPEDLAEAATIKRQEEAMNQLRQFCTQYPNRQGQQVVHQPIVQHLVKTHKEVVAGILQTALEQEAELIILGTRAKHSLKEYVLGSISTRLIEQADVGICCIPESATYRTIQRIGFATKINIGQYPVVTRLQHLAKALHASIHQVYVETLPYDISDQYEQVMSSPGLSQAGEAFAKIVVIRDRSIERGLDYFIEKHSIDLLAMHIPYRAPIEKIFYRSQAKKMIFNSALPLLFFHE